MSAGTRFLLFAGLTALGLGFWPAGATPVRAEPRGQAGTTLVADVGASGTWEHIRDHDWAITKEAAATSLELAQGGEAELGYRLRASRTLARETGRFAVTGEVCITNGGERATEGLAISVRVQAQTGDGFADLPGAAQRLNPAQLAPGASSCTPYEIDFQPPGGDPQLRSVAKVTITNHSGQLGVAFGPEPKADFRLPGTPEVIDLDLQASLSDAVSCPTGLECTSEALVAGTLSDSQEMAYAVRIRSAGLDCGQSATLGNEVALTESDSGALRLASAAVVVSTPPCPETPTASPTGCTRTIGFWKTHAGFSGHNADLVTPLLPITLGELEVATAEEAVSILAMEGSASNGIVKLQAQLLGARLNLASGAGGAGIQDVLPAALAFLGDHDAADWPALTTAQREPVLAWMEALDAYNNGLAGPEHCDGGPRPPAQPGPGKGQEHSKKR